MDRFLLAITFFNYIGGISIEKYFLHENNYFGIDLSQKALTVAKHNAKKNNVAEEAIKHHISPI